MNRNSDCVGTVLYLYSVAVLQGHPFIMINEWIRRPLQGPLLISYDENRNFPHFSPPLPQPIHFQFGFTDPNPTHLPPTSPPSALYN